MSASLCKHRPLDAAGSPSGDNVAAHALPFGPVREALKETGQGSEQPIAQVVTTTPGPIAGITQAPTAPRAPTMDQCHVVDADTASPKRLRLPANPRRNKVPDDKPKRVAIA